MSDDLTLPQKIERLGEDANLLHEWTHGDETASVALGGVDTPSPRKLMHELDLRESAAAQAAIAAGVTAAGNSAAAAAQSAQIASAGADVVTAHAQSIELVAANIEAVQGASGNADAAAASAAAAAASAAAAAGASSGLAPRMDAVESKSIQQDTRLDAVELKSAQQTADIANNLTALTDKADTNLGNATALPQGILKPAINASGEAPIYAARAWALFDMSGSGAIKASKNIASMTINNVGQATFSFIQDMPDEKYAIVGASSSQTNTAVNSLAAGDSVVARTSHSFRLSMSCYTTVLSGQNPTAAGFAVFA